MGCPPSYPGELGERGVRMVLETEAEYAGEFTAIVSMSTKLGIGSLETLRRWVRRAEIDSGQRPGVTTEESEQTDVAFTALRADRQAQHTKPTAPAGPDTTLTTVA